MPLRPIFGHQLNSNNMKKIFFLAFFIASSLSSFAQNYKISGTVDLSDGTWLYMGPANQKLDSAQVNKGTFTMAGKMAEPISRVYLHTDRYTNYLSFWLEETPLTIKLKAGEFKKAIITGSKTEEDDKKLELIKKSIKSKQDSLNKLIELAKSDEVKKKLVAEYHKARNQEHEMDITYIQNHPNSIISVNLLAIFSSTWGKEKIKPLYQNLSKDMQNTSYGKDVQQFIELNRNVKVGDHFVDFEQMNANGKKVKLSDIKGKYILLDFWAAWCGPCLEENPSLVLTYKQFKDKGFAILGVSADDNKSLWLNAIKKDQLPWENVSDLKGDKNEAALIYGISAYPTNYLIDEKGKIIAKNLRGEALKKKLGELLD